jgi:sulfite exporter TauE/SafE
MDASFLGAMAALGLASGVHCAGMCGGIVTAFSLGNPAQRSAGRTSRRLFFFNAGRISSYAVAGALAGTLGWYAGGPQTALLILANVVLVFVGLHLAGWSSPMRWLERLGAPLWARIQPLASHLMRTPGIPAAYGTGLAWGLLPCGLVYGALTAAAFAGSPAAGAAAMLAFGIGTLPWLMAAGVTAARARDFLRFRFVRLAVGGTVLGFGAWGLAHAGTNYLCS